ncbi:hypothetical protein HK098_005598 [Nowakowskiella sp. JEL0407]|nr:hypothetical protein HK098_005598 [Nowakowskiella sp. JEL0407]
MQQIPPKSLLIYSKLTELPAVNFLSLSRPQLKIANSIIGLSSIGFTFQLKYRYQKWSRFITKDDVKLKEYGIDNLTPLELREALEMRGISTSAMVGKGEIVDEVDYKMSEEDISKLRKSLKEYLDVASIKPSVPLALILIHNVIKFHVKM